LYLSKTSGFFEVSEMGEGELLVELLHSIELGDGEMQQSSSQFHEWLFKFYFTLQMILESRQQFS
jgi:hypothetical protein